MRHKQKSTFGEASERMPNLIKDLEDGNITAAEAEMIIKTAKSEIKSVKKVLALLEKELQKAYQKQKSQ